MSLRALIHPGVLAALGAAVLFGSSTPLAKVLLGKVSPLVLAGLLYLGSGLGLFLYRWIRRSGNIELPRKETLWLLIAVTAGGVVAPVLLLLGLSRIPASSASLLLNAEGVFTALLAWFIFKENFDRRIVVGMVCIVIGALFLSWPSDQQITQIWSSLAVIGACLAWALDNNFMRKVALVDATWLAAVKGVVAGTVNLILGLGLGDSLPAAHITASAMSIGFVSYGVSMALFVVALRLLGTARTGAYFSVAPFFGACIAVVMGEAITLQLSMAGIFMGIGVWLHLTENHSHQHTHETMEHDHEHVHDEHHRHEHDFPVAEGARHCHAHRHETLTHTHAHYPDAHHLHKH